MEKDWQIFKIDCVFNFWLTCIIYTYTLSAFCINVLMLNILIIPGDIFLNQWYIQTNETQHVKWIHKIQHI